MLSVLIDPFDTVLPKTVNEPLAEVLDELPIVILPNQSNEALICAVVKDDPLAKASPTKNLIVVTPSNPRPHAYLLLVESCNAIHGCVCVAVLATDTG